MSEFLFKVIASYLLGSIVGSLLIGKLRGGIDIRNLGSGNAGGTNALRTQGKSFALGVLLIDIGKGWLATRIVAPMVVTAVDVARPELRMMLPAACGVAVIAGHVYPIWHGFRGGKGMATLVGAVLGLDAWLLVPMLLTWLIVVVLIGYVGLASMTAAASLPAYVELSGAQPHVPLLSFGIIATFIILFTHRANIGRMVAGTESRARRLWLLGRRRK